MTIDQIQVILELILSKAEVLKIKYISEPLGTVDYVGIFPISDAQNKEISADHEQL